MKEYKGQKHDVFPVGLLERYHESTIPGHVEPPPPPVGDEEDEYDLEEVLDSKVINREVKYMVRWKFLPDTFPVKVEVDRIIKENGWDKEKKK